LVSQNVINQWWVRRRGMVMGFSGIILSLIGLGGFPNLINGLISSYGWRPTYILLGFILLFIMVPVGYLFFRDRPEDYGLLPDGDKHPPLTIDTAPDEAIEENWTLAEARRTPIFWVFLFGGSSIGMLATGLFFHIVSIFEDNGLDPDLVASVYVPIAVTTAIFRLGSGILVGRVRLRTLLATALFLQALALMMAQFLSSAELAFLYGVVLGATLGLSSLVASVSWATYFGRQHLGSITGFTTSIGIAGSALGPMPMGIAHDLLGSYNLALTVSATLPLLLGILTLFVDRPRKRT
jgi:sugar phosphate permease